MKEYHSDLLPSTYLRFWWYPFLIDTSSKLFVVAVIFCTLSFLNGFLNER